MVLIWGHCLLFFLIFTYFIVVLIVFFLLICDNTSSLRNIKFFIIYIACIFFPKYAHYPLKVLKTFKNVVSIIVVWYFDNYI